MPKPSTVVGHEVRELMSAGGVPGGSSSKGLKITPIDASDREAMKALAKEQPTSFSSELLSKLLESFKTALLGDTEVVLLDNLLLSGTSTHSVTFAAADGQMVTFQWQFEAGDYMPFNDTAWYTFNGSEQITLSSVSMVGDYGSSGWQSKALVAGSGENSLVFGITDVGDGLLPSTLYIDDLLLI